MTLNPKNDKPSDLAMGSQCQWLGPITPYELVEKPCLSAITGAGFAWFNPNQGCQVGKPRSHGSIMARGGTRSGICYVCAARDANAIRGESRKKAPIIGAKFT